MTDQSFNEFSAFVLYIDPEYAQIARSAPKSMILNMKGHSIILLKTYPFQQETLQLVVHLVFFFH